MKKKIIILGAGPCGLGTLWQLRNAGYDHVRLYEQSDHAGGLCSSYVDAQGFLWDIGGHVLATKNKDFLDDIRLLYKDSLQQYVRSAWVRIGPSMIAYPIQYHVKVPKETKTTIHGSSFYRWIYQSFGASLATTFFLPFNKKLWKYPLTKMSTSWLTNKIPQYSETHKSHAWGANASFYYPSRGGIGSVWERIAATVQPYISYKKQVVAIDATTHTIRFSDRSTDRYDVLVSTIPLPRLSSIMQGIAITHVSSLPYVGIAAVGIGMRGTQPKELRRCHWIYIPNSNIPYFRVSVYSNYGKENAPKGTWSLLFEMTTNQKTIIDRDALIATTIAHARLQGFIPNDTEVVSTFFHHEPFGYPIPIMNRDHIVSKVHTLLEQHAIYSLGRFGSWCYEKGNMDNVWMQGTAWADQWTKHYPLPRH